MIRLIASDLDGTLLEADGKLPKDAFDVINRLSAMGIRFAASSGRQYGNLQRLFGPVAQKMAFVCENGALDVMDGETVGVIALEANDAKEILQDVKEAGMNLLVSGRHTCYVLDQNRRFADDMVYRLRNTVTIISSLDEIYEPILKISGQIDEGVERLAPAFLKKWGDRVTASISGAEWFDFTLANKGKGIRMLMQRMQLQKNEVAAFGDNFNDETMLDTVGHPFIMEQAHPALKQKGYHVCCKVLPVLEKLIEAGGDEAKWLDSLA